MIKLLGFLLGSPSCLFPRFLPPPSGVFPRCLPHSPRYVVDLQNSAFCGYPPSGWGGFFVLTHACATPNRTATRARTLVQAGITAKGSHRTARLDVTRLQHTLASQWIRKWSRPRPGRRPAAPHARSVSVQGRFVGALDHGVLSGFARACERAPEQPNGGVDTAALTGPSPDLSSSLDHDTAWAHAASSVRTW